MPEAPTVDAPPEAAEAPFGTQAFGSLSDAFNDAFPATADPENDAPAPEIETEQPKPEVAPAKKPDAPAKPTGDELPDSLFATPEKKEEPKPEEVPEIEAPKGLKPKEQVAWKEIRSREQEATKRVSELTIELETLKKAPHPKDDDAAARVAELERSNAELSERIATVDLQSHPAFINKFTKPLEQLMGGVNDLLQTVDKDPAQLERAMSLKGKQRIQALDDFFDDIESPTVRTKVSHAVDQIEALDSERASVLADAKGNHQRLSEHDKATQFQQAQQQKKKLETLFDDTVVNLRDKHGLEVLKESGVEWWDKQREQVLEAARHLMFDMDDPADAAAATVLAATSSVHRGLWLKERNQRIELMKELESYKNADPDLKGGSDRAVDEGDSKLSFAERVASGSGLR